MREPIKGSLPPIPDSPSQPSLKGYPTDADQRRPKIRFRPFGVGLFARGCPATIGITRGPLSGSGVRKRMVIPCSIPGAPRSLRNGRFQVASLNAGGLQRIRVFIGIGQLNAQRSKPATPTVPPCTIGRPSFEECRPCMCRAHRGSKSTAACAAIRCKGMSATF